MLKSFQWDQVQCAFELQQSTNLNSREKTVSTAIVSTFKKLFLRYFLLQACLYGYSASALALSLAVSGSQNPEDLVCPGTVSKATPSVVKPSPSQPREASMPNAASDVNSPRTPPIHESAADYAIPSSIGFWGDSHLAAGFFSDELVLELGLNKSDVKPGFLPPTMGRAGVRLPIRKYCKSAGWRFADAYVARHEQQQVGPALTVLENTREDSMLWVDFRNHEAGPALQRLTVLFREISEAPVVLEIGVDDATPQRVLLEKGESRLELNPAHPLSQLKLQVVSGSLGLEGFAPVYTTPSRLKLDIFGIPGSTVRSWRILDPLYLQSRLDQPSYKLVILEYGTNEGADRNFDIESYQSGLNNSLRGMRAAFPYAKCLLIGPTDRGTRLSRSSRNKPEPQYPGDAIEALASQPNLLEYANIHAHIAGIQKSLAQTYGCHFWDWQAAMGGPGGAYEWLNKSPPLMAKDLTHLTRIGYETSARMLAKEIALKAWLQ